nr:MAG TPA: minor capsid protein [Microviridae sp.]
MNYDFLGLGQLFGGAIQTGVNWGINKKNLEHQKEVFNWQKEQQAWANQFAKDQFEYQKQQNDLTRQREDNAIQRRQADLKQAGLNPLSAGDNGGASAQTIGGSTMAGGSQQGTAPQMEQLAGLDNLFQGVMNIMTQKQNIAQSQTDQAYTEEKTRTERENQKNIGADTSKKNAETKEIERKTDFYDTLASREQAEITAIEKENELRELRKATEIAREQDLQQNIKDKDYNRRASILSGTKTHEQSYYNYGIGKFNIPAKPTQRFENWAMELLGKAFGW